VTFKPGCPWASLHFPKISLHFPKMQGETGSQQTPSSATQSSQRMCSAPDSPEGRRYHGRTLPLRVFEIILSNLYLNEVDRMLERAKETTRYGKYTYIEYARFADDLVILIVAFVFGKQRQRPWLRGHGPRPQ
jgi:hypothetical protein